MYAYTVHDPDVDHICRACVSRDVTLTGPYRDIRDQADNFLVKRFLHCQEIFGGV